MRLFYNAFALFFCFLITGCDLYVENRIPMDVSVSLRINVNTNDKELKQQLGTKRYVNTPNIKIPTNYPFSITDLTGYGGILVVHGLDYNLHAYDLSCPVEALTTIRLNVVDDGLNVECPKCKSKYEIAQGYGTPISGEASKQRYILKKYSVSSIQSNGEVYIFR